MLLIVSGNEFLAHLAINLMGKKNMQRTNRFQIIRYMYTY